MRSAALALSLALPFGALAQAPEAAPGARDAAEQRAESFQAVEGPVKEDIPGGPLLVAGYGVLWVALLLYVVRLARQQQVLRRDLVRLERVLGDPPTSK